MSKTIFDKDTDNYNDFIATNEAIEIYKREAERAYRLLRLCIIIMGIIILALIFLVRW